MSRLNVKDNSTYGNVNTHIFTEFSTLAKETTQKEVLSAIKDIKINVGEIVVGDITVESNDTITHDKLDTLTSAVINKHLNSGLDSVEIGSIANDIVINTNVNNFPSSFEVSNFPTNQTISGTVDVSNNFATDATLTTTNNKLDTQNIYLSNIDTTTQNLFSNSTSTNTKLDTINTTITNKHLTATDDEVTVVGDVSVSNMITGFALDSTIDTTNSKLDTINTTITNKHLTATDDEVTVVGNVSVSNMISGFALDSSIGTTNTKLDTINTTITDKHLNKLVDSVDISGQSISISNQISGYSTSALQTTGNNLLTDIKNKTINSNTDSITVWAGNDDFKIRNLSATVDNVDVGLGTYSYQNRNPPFPASRDVLGVQLCAVDDLSGTNLINLVSNTDGSLNTNITNTVDVSGSIDVGNFPTSFEVSNFPTSFEVSNFPTSFEVSNFPTSFEVSNQINGFALESGGNLASIKTNTDKIKSDAVHTDAIQVEVKNTTVPISGSISNAFTLDTTSQTTNTKLDTIHADLDGLTFDGSSNLNVNIASGTISSVNIKDSSGNNLNSTSNALNNYITNSNINTHCYGSSDGSTWHHILTNSNGKLQTNAGIQDNNGADITSTLVGSKQSLDVNVADTVTVSGSVNSNLKDGAGNSITSIVDSGNRSLNVHVSNTSNIPIDIKNISLANGTVPIALNDGASNSITSTASGIHNSLDVNVVGTVPVSGTFYQATQPVSISGSVPVTGTFYQATQPVSISGSVPVTGTFYQATQPVSGSINIKDTSGGTISTTGTSINSNITNSSLSVTGFVDAYVKDGSGNSIGSLSGALNVNSINDATTNYNNKVGLNVYPIITNQKSYIMGGYDANATANAILGGSSTAAIPVTTYNFGLAVSRIYYATMSAGTNTMYIDYVNSSGDLVENAGPYSLSTGITTLPNCISINNFYLTASMASTEIVYIGINGSTATTVKQTSVAGEDINQKCIGVFTCPNNYIGILTSISSNSNSATGIQLNKWSSLGVRTIGYKFNNTGTVFLNSGSDGDLCYLKAGETVCFSHQGAVAAGTFGNIVLKSFL